MLSNRNLKRIAKKIERQITLEKARAWSIDRTKEKAKRNIK
jgi:choline dehydrogenase-like flavoprotein